MALTPLVFSSTQDKQLQFRFYDSYNNQTINNVGFMLNITKLDKKLMYDAFFARDGNIALKFLPGGTEGKWNVIGDQDPISGGWDSSTGKIEIFSPIFSNPGFYKIHLDIISAYTDHELFDIKQSPKFDYTVNVEGNGSGTILSPMQQFRSGISLQDIKCGSGLILLAKTSDNSPACVKPTTAQKLVERGWRSSSMISKSLSDYPVERTWVEMNKISCYGNFCSIDWLKSYYNSSNYFSYGSLTHVVGANFNQTSAYLKDYYGKLGIPVYDVKISLVWACIFGAGECPNNYKLQLLVSNADVGKMLNLGYKISGPSSVTRETFPSTIKVNNADFTIPYDIYGGTVTAIKQDLQSKSFIISVQTTWDGILTIQVPRAFYDAKAEGQDDPFYILENGQQSDYKEIEKTTTYRTVVIPFKQGTEEIEFIGTQILSGH